MKSLLVFGALLLACLGAWSASLSLTPVADTTISDGDGAHVSGADITLIVGGLEALAAPARGLLRFDLSSLPATAVVTSATVTVSVTRSRAGGAEHPHRLHRLLTPWDEMMASWFDSGSSGWVGGDFLEDLDASISLADIGNFTFASSAELVATVRLWQTNSAANHGWILINGEESTPGTARRISAREASSDRPTLTIGYSEPPPPPADFNVTSPGSYYAINGTEPNPELTLVRGSNYVFDINTDSTHPFQISTGSNFGDPPYESGVVNNNISSGRITFDVPLDAPDTLYYVCSFHFFFGVIRIVDPAAPPAPLVRIVSMDLSSSNVVLRSLGTNGWSAFPEFSSNLLSSNWAVVPTFTNTLVNGTNVTVFDRLDPICGPNVFLRVRNVRE